MSSHRFFSWKRSRHPSVSSESRAPSPMLPQLYMCPRLLSRAADERPTQKFFTKFRGCCPTSSPTPTETALRKSRNTTSRSPAVPQLRHYGRCRFKAAKRICAGEGRARNPLEIEMLSAPPGIHRRPRESAQATHSPGFPVCPGRHPLRALPGESTFGPRSSYCLRYPAPQRPPDSVPARIVPQYAFRCIWRLQSSSNSHAADDAVARHRSP